MTPFWLAWRTVRRYRARAVLAIVGVAVIGALNFDMLLLSRGLLLSFAQLINGTGYNIRVAGNSGFPLSRTPIDRAGELLTRIQSLPEVRSAALMRTSAAAITTSSRQNDGFELIGSSDPDGLGIWRQLSGSTLGADAGDPSIPPAIVAQAMMDRLKLEVGSVIRIRVRMAGALSAVPEVPFRIVGVADFPFESADAFLIATTMEGFKTAHGGVLSDEAGLMFAQSRAANPDAAVAAIAALRPDIRAFSNEQIIENFGRNAFTYFRQISVVLSATTGAFSFLLVAALLTVSVNQRLGEVAALRALGIARRRIAATLLWESALLVGIGGVFALPVGEVVAGILDRILRRMPGLPSGLHFFVFEPQSLVVHALVLVATALVAAMYPAWLAVKLPIAQTLRQEVVS